MTAKQPSAFYVATSYFFLLYKGETYKWVDKFRPVKIKTEGRYEGVSDLWPEEAACRLYNLVTVKLKIWSDIS